MSLSFISILLGSIITAVMCGEECNSSETENHSQLSQTIRSYVSVSIMQVFVWPFIYINLLMLFTFYRKQAFRTETRYVLFVHTLLVDLLFLLVTDFVVILSVSHVLMPLVFCIPFCMLMEAATTSTPLTIAAMCVERYVAICMPLRHSAISTSSHTFTVVVIIYIISSINTTLDLFILVTTVPPEYLVQFTLCYYEIMTPEKWHQLLRASLYIVVFVFTLLVELICYLMIMLSARAASINKKSAAKGLRTIMLHMLQLTLCTIDLICPYIEVLLRQVDIQLYLSVRLFNFITFYLIAKAISPLVYGLRDKNFSTALVSYIRCQENQIASENI